MFYQTLLFAVIFRCAKSQTVNDFYQLSAVDIHGTKVMQICIFVLGYLSTLALCLSKYLPRLTSPRCLAARCWWWTWPASAATLTPTTEASRGSTRSSDTATSSRCWVSGQCSTEEILQHFSPAFPCNQFGGQEPGTAADIREVAFKRYGARFTVMEKVEVTGPGQHPVWRFLTGEWSICLLHLLFRHLCNFES